MVAVGGITGWLVSYIYTTLTSLVDGCVLSLTELDLFSNLASNNSSYYERFTYDKLSASLTSEGAWMLGQYGSILALAIVIYNIGFTPMNRVRSLSDVGWSYIATSGVGSNPLRGGRGLAEQIREVQRLKKTGDLPPVYPNGWFSIAESKDLKKGQVISVNAVGQNLAVFRSCKGEVHATDAYCPHLGANLAVGGVVKGDCLECPFHGWQFNGNDGRCTHIPYSQKVPEFAKVKAWKVIEANGRIFLWHDAEGREPLWDMLMVPDIENGSWHYRGRTEHEIMAHIQEIPENGADIHHLSHLHVPNIFKGSDLNDTFAAKPVMDIAEHAWNGDWKTEDEEHMASIQLSHGFTLFGGKFEIFSMKVKALQIGPGLVHLYFNTSIGSGVLIQSVTPIAPMMQKVIHTFYTSRTFIAPYAKLVLHCEAEHVERDIMIWNSKQFYARPLLLKEDRRIKEFRRWYQQFYSENSPKFTFHKEDLAW